MAEACPLLVLCLVCSIVKVNSQQLFPSPNVTFIGETLANHSYVNLSLVGISDSDSVQCHTDLTTCCSSVQGSHRGDWYFPDGTRVYFSGDISEQRGPQRVDLRRISGTSPTYQQSLSMMILTFQ